MRVFDQIAYETVLKRNESHPANPFTEVAMRDGVSYLYMSEVDPHRDESDEDHETIWTINFLAAKEDFFFIYHFNGVKHCIEPELNTPYQFNFRELHGFLHKENLQFFENEEHWADFNPTSGLACVFMIVNKE